MKLSYSTNKLKKILEDNKLIWRNYSKFAERLITVLDVLRAEPDLKSIPETMPLRRHKLSNDKKGYWGVCINKNYRLIIKPVGQFDDNDLSTVKEIEITEIEDYH